MAPTFGLFGSGAPTFGLFGSGEFLPWASEVDRHLISAGGAGRAPLAGARVLILPTASAPEGDATFDRWGAMGMEHYRRLGAEPEVLAVKVRPDAGRPDLVQRVAGASLIYFSGGNPAYLARTLAGTPFWAAVTDAVRAGCSLAGSSAGIAFLGAKTFDPAAMARAARAAVGDPPLSLWVDGLGLFSRATFGPHWDAVERWRPGAGASMLAGVPEGATFLGVDEDTAVLGDGVRWQVWGRGTATVLAPGTGPVVVASGARFEADLGYAPSSAGTGPA